MTPPEARTLSELSKRGLVLKSPFFTMMDNNNSKKPVSVKSSSSSKSSSSNSDSKNNYIENGEKISTDNNNNMDEDNNNIPQSTITTTPCKEEKNLMHEAANSETTSNIIRNNSVDSNSSSNSSTDNDASTPIPESTSSFHSRQLSDNYYDPGDIQDNDQQIELSNGADVGGDDVSSYREPEDVDTTLMAEKSPPQHEEILTPPRPTEAPPPPPPSQQQQEQGEYQYPQMSRQSVLEAFENDLKDLLLLEGKSALNPEYGNSEVVDGSSIIQPHQQLSSPRHSNSNSNASNNGFRFSRSTISSYGGQDVTELDMEDPKSPVSISSNSGNTNKPLPPIDAAMMMDSYNEDDNDTISHPPLPPLASAETQQQQTSNTSAGKKLSRMSSDMESKMKRGRVSLRRKSAATLRLSTLSFHSPQKDSSPQVISAAAIFEPFLNDEIFKNATPANYPEDHEHIPLWFLRQIMTSKSNPSGAFLSENLYVSNDMWAMDHVHPRVLEPRVSCLKDLTKLAADHIQQDEHESTTTNIVDNLNASLDSLESTFNSAFITPLDGDIVEPMTSPRRSSSTTTSASSALAPTTSQSTTHPQQQQQKNPTALNPSSTSSSTSSSSSRASGVFKRLRKKSIIGHSNEHSNNATTTSPPLSEPQTPTETEKNHGLDNYLSSIASLAAALESVQQNDADSNNTTSENGRWLKAYRCFVAHVACRLILKDITVLQDIYKTEFRDYLGK